MKELSNTKYVYLLDKNCLFELYSGTYLYFDREKISVYEIEKKKAKNILKNNDFRQYVGYPAKYIIKDIQEKLVNKFIPRKE